MGPENLLKEDLKTENAGYVISPVEAEARRSRVDRVLSTLAEETARSTGVDFLKVLVRHLAEAVGFKYALVGEVYGEKKENLKTLALWTDGKESDNIAYALSGTPCGNVAGKTVCAYLKNTWKLFPDDGMLKDLKIESYIGAPIFDSSGSPLGVLAAFHDEPAGDASDLRLMLSTFVIRAGIELKRIKAGDEKKTAEEGLQRIVREKTVELERANEALRHELEALRKYRDESAMLYGAITESSGDFIFIIGADLCVRFINRTAAAFLGCRRDDMQGRRLDEIFPPSIHGFIMQNLEEVFRTGKPYFREEDFSSRGRSLWLGTRLSPVAGEDGKVTAVLGISREITSRFRK